MSTKHETDDIACAGQNLSGEADYEAVVTEIIDRLSKSWRIPKKPASAIPGRLVPAKQAKARLRGLLSNGGRDPAG